MHKFENIRSRRQLEFHSGGSHNPCLLKTLAEFVSPAGKKA
jgi:hypothetical protein